MRVVLWVLVVTSGIVLSGFVYQQAVVEGSLGPSAIIFVCVLSVAFLVLLAMLWLTWTRYRGAVGNILLIGFSVVVTYFAVDLVAGWLLIKPLSPRLVRDDVLHHVMVPNSFSEFRQRDFDYVQRVNNIGLRGGDITLEKPPSTVRILMLGDSFTMGKGVEDDETFTYLVGVGLRAKLEACAGPRIEVLNGGVDSYAPILSYLQFKSELARLDPDLVVLNLDNSDLVQETVYRRTAIFAADGAPLAVPAEGRDSLYERFRNWSERRLYLTRLALTYVNRTFDYGELTVRQVVNELGREHLAHTLEGDIDRREQWRGLFDSLSRIKALADTQDTKFLLTTYPWGHQVGDGEWMMGRRPYIREGERTSDVTANTIREFARTGGIDLLEAVSAFKDYDGGERLYFEYDPHWTRAGHRVMASALMHYLEQRYLRAWCSVGSG